MIKIVDSSADETNETNFVSQAKKGNREAFDALIRAHLPRIYSTLFYMSGNHEDAEDLAQEVFVRAFLALPSFRGESQFATWLYSIALYVSRDFLRARKRRPAIQSLDNIRELSKLFSLREEPSKSSSEKEISAQLLQYVHKLPPTLKAVFVLRFFENLDYAEISEILGISTGTARVHSLKARRLLMRWTSPLLKEERE